MQSSTMNRPKQSSKTMNWRQKDDGSIVFSLRDLNSKSLAAASVSPTNGGGISSSKSSSPHGGSSYDGSDEENTVRSPGGSSESITSPTTLAITTKGKAKVQKASSSGGNPFSAASIITEDQPKILSLSSRQSLGRPSKAKSKVRPSLNLGGRKTDRTFNSRRLGSPTSVTTSTSRSNANTSSRLRSRTSTVLLKPPPPPPKTSIVFRGDTLQSVSGPTKNPKKEACKIQQGRTETKSPLKATAKPFVMPTSSYSPPASSAADTVISGATDNNTTGTAAAGTTTACATDAKEYVPASDSNIFSAITFKDDSSGSNDDVDVVDADRENKNGNSGIEDTAEKKAVAFAFASESAASQNSGRSAGAKPSYRKTPHGKKKMEKMTHLRGKRIGNSTATNTEDRSAKKKNEVGEIKSPTLATSLVSSAAASVTSPSSRISNASIVSSPPPPGFEGVSPPTTTPTNTPASTNGVAIGGLRNNNLSAPAVIRTAGGSIGIGNFALDGIRPRSLISPDENAALPSWTTVFLGTETESEADEKVSKVVDSKLSPNPGGADASSGAVDGKIKHPAAVGTQTDIEEEEEGMETDEKESADSHEQESKSNGEYRGGNDDSLYDSLEEVVEKVENMILDKDKNSGTIEAAPKERKVKETTDGKKINPPLSPPSLVRRGSVGNLGPSSRGSDARPRSDNYARGKGKSRSSARRQQLQPAPAQGPNQHYAESHGYSVYPPIAYQPMKMPNGLVCYMPVVFSPAHGYSYSYSPYGYLPYPIANQTYVSPAASSSTHTSTTRSNQKVSGMNPNARSFLPKNRK